jgi:hypothetical protein
MRTYSHAEEAAANLPYGLMALIGGAVLAVSSGGATWGWVAAAGYVAYALLGAFWIMVFVCPYCAFFDTRSCPCGYGQVAARFRKKSSIECFAVQFKKHIPAIVPFWLLPVVIGGWAVYRGFSWLLMGLMVGFVVDAWVILPLVSRRHGCTECPQKDNCPWMGPVKAKEVQG